MQINYIIIRDGLFTIDSEQLDSGILIDITYDAELASLILLEYILKDRFKSINKFNQDNYSYPM